MHFVQKTWGYEIWIENNPLYCGKHLHVVPNKWCSIHYHKNKKETFYVIDGELKIQYSTNLSPIFWADTDAAQVATTVLKKGDSLTIEPLTAHRFTANLSYACDFIEISTFHEDSDSYRILAAT